MFVLFHLTLTIFSKFTENWWEFRRNILYRGKKVLYKVFLFFFLSSFFCALVVVIVVITYRHRRFRPANKPTHILIETVARVSFVRCHSLAASDWKWWQDTWQSLSVLIYWVASTSSFPLQMLDVTARTLVRICLKTYQ